MASITVAGVGEGEGRAIESSEVRLSSVCHATTSSGGETDVFVSGGGPDVKEWTTIPCVVRAVVGLSEVVEMRGLSVIV